jgi:hypothetical protein
MTPESLGAIDKAEPNEAFPASGHSSVVGETNHCFRYFMNSASSGNPAIVMFHAGSRPKKHGWQDLGLSRALQKTEGSARRTRQQSSFPGSSHWKKSSIHDALGSEMKDEFVRFRSASRMLDTEKSSQVVKRPQRACWFSLLVTSMLCTTK